MHNKYYEQGWDARAGKSSVRDNPYEYGSYERAQWYAGYEDCKQLQYIASYSVMSRLLF